MLCSNFVLGNKRRPSQRKKDVKDPPPSNLELRRCEGRSTCLAQLSDSQGFFFSFSFTKGIIFAAEACGAFLEVFQEELALSRRRERRKRTWLSPASFCFPNPAGKARKGVERRDRKKSRTFSSCVLVLAAVASYQIIPRRPTPKAKACLHPQ